MFTLCSQPEIAGCCVVLVSEDFEYVVRECKVIVIGAEEGLHDLCYAASI